MTIERIRELIDRGAPWEACDAFRELAASSPAGDAGLYYWGALAHARSGAAREAHALLDRARPLAEAAGATALLVEILSLRGRLFKDAVHRRTLHRHPATGVPLDDALRPLAVRARDAYLTAWRIANDPFPGINVATLSLLLGDRESAARFARDVIARLGAEPQSAWYLASLGEAQLLLGDVAGAIAAYAAAFGACGGNGGTVASMRRQLALIARVLPQAAAVMEAVPAASVVAFAGHMVDAAGRHSPRLPPARVPALAAALRTRVAALRDPIVYTSAACGADLLFIDAAIERGAEVNVVLPFDRDDFVRTSVAIGGESWIARFESALAHAHRVIMATDEQYLGDDILFDHAARLVEGYAVLRAEQLQA
ncbi:MAG TPA: tetratricopeptide repeat-containing protein, partial [Casimicrobiaceae bacterium]